MSSGRCLPRTVTPSSLWLLSPNVELRLGRVSVRRDGEMTSLTGIKIRNWSNAGAPAPKIPTGNGLETSPAIQ